VCPQHSSDGQAERRRALLERAEQVAGIGSWEFDPDSGELEWSDNHFRIMGIEPGAITPTVAYIVEHTLPDDQASVIRHVRRLGSDEQLRPLEYRFLLPDGTVRHLRSYAAIRGEDSARPRLIVGAIQDITERKLAEREIAAHVAVAEALAEWDSFEQGAEGLLRGLATAMGCVAAVLWIPDGDVLVPRVMWHALSVDLSEFDALTRNLRFPIGSGLPGQVWETRQPMNVTGIRDDPVFARRAPAGRDRLRGLVALPALVGDEVMAVLELHSREESEPTKRLMRSLSSIGHEIGQFLRSRHGEIKPLPLSERELEVLTMMASGASNGEMAKQLVVSQSTISSHVKHILRKLAVRNRTEAVARFLVG
jgi:DNA-binding CsgD family transcriptional regulator